MIGHYNENIVSNFWDLYNKLRKSSLPGISCGERPEKKLFDTRESDGKRVTFSERDSYGDKDDDDAEQQPIPQ